ncbi:MAG TPA: hypothetical protein VF867_20070 [Arthrobacter sp.]
MLKTILTATAVLFGVAVVLGLVTFILMLLMNLAFPALAFNFWQSLALMGIFTLIGLPAMATN